MATELKAAYRLLTERPLSLYAAAVLRIGYGLLYFVMLAREFPHRHEIWGPQSPWTPDLARQMSADSGWFTFLTLSDGRAYFEICYALALVIAVLFLLGWRTRAVSILFALVVVAFYGRNVLITDGGDNLTVLMAIYLCGTACGRRWSLDARRTRGRPEQTGTRQFAVTAVHNCAMLIIMAQMCILYGAAGLYKVQGGLWENGTALHYVLNSDLFRPWPALSDFMDGHHVLLAIAGYVTVLVQVAFPFSLFSKLKYVLLVILIGMHLGIAVLVGLPMFSAVMILGDAVFLPDRFFRFLAREVKARAITGNRAVPVR
ncbi:HTTM domain-containing protein [Actinoplanes subtropicus]|uniref:HTTM domain-containing protein n=1 Tax=Actinoplanes subtropicus TaxID=543632 RepID=UPI00068A0E83|nr:HTTM domain-containing protein [Actinoplanes subtropicus]